MAPRGARKSGEVPPPPREKRIDKCRINPDLLISKLFYLFFYGAFGSLFPLLSIYFKQLGMNATHAGILVGVRPFVEFISAPLWGGFADRFRRGKILLIFSVSAWIVFTSALYFVQPSTSFCLLVYNRTDFVLESTRTTEVDGFSSKNQILVKTRLNKYAAPGLAPEFLQERHNISGYNRTEHGKLVKPPASSRVYKRLDVDKAFFILLTLVVIGEFFSAPAITLADACTLHYLGDAPECYGKQRMYGSVGWAVSMFAIGMALDYGAFSNKDCGQRDVHERNYTICFVFFASLMLVALAIATRLEFFYDFEKKSKPGQNGNGETVSGLRYNALEGTFESKVPKETELTELIDGAWPKSNKETHHTKWISFLKTFATVQHLSFLFVVWWFGFGVGLIFCFLFWHLQDIGGSPSIFGIASVINHSSEIVAYFFTTNLITYIGHVKVLYVGLLANVARFLYVSWLKDPWFVLPLEVVQGISHAAVWAAATSYIALAAPPMYKSSAQGILQGLHYGLGRACGALIGGVIITHFGSELMFRGYGISCAVVFVVFFFVNRVWDTEGIQTPTVSDERATSSTGNGIAMDTLYSSTEVGLAAASMGNLYGSTDRIHSDRHEPKVLR